MFVGKECVGRRGLESVQGVCNMSRVVGGGRPSRA